MMWSEGLPFYNETYANLEDNRVTLECIRTEGSSNFDVKLVVVYCEQVDLGFVLILFLTFPTDVLNCRKKTMSLSANSSETKP